MTLFIYLLLFMSPSPWQAEPIQTCEIIQEGEVARERCYSSSDEAEPEASWAR